MLGGNLGRPRARHRAMMLALMGGASLLSAAHDAAAQTAGAGVPDLEEVVVTARRVEENLQSVPVAVRLEPGREPLKNPFPATESEAKGEEVPMPMLPP